MKSGIKIAIGGKGGVGKTTVCAVWAKLFADEGLNVLALDADPDANLASAFGLGRDRHPEPLMEMKELIAERTGTDKDSIGSYFKLNPNVADLPQRFCLVVNGLKLLVLGGLKQAGRGCACPEGAFLKAMLSHIILNRQEVIIVDLAAGVEFMGRASVQGTDAMVIVVEPGSRSIETANNVAEMAQQLGINTIGAIANKITEPSQIGAIESQLKNIELLASLKYTDLIQKADLERKPVYNADKDMVNSLKNAKNNLLELFRVRQSDVNV